MRKLRLAVLGFIAAVTMLTLSPAYGQELRLRARLNGPAIDGLTPSGQAQFRAIPGQRTFTTEVEDVNLPEGTVLAVSIFANQTETPVGNLTLGPPPVRGGDLNLSTGSGDVIPAMRPGTIVVVRGPDGAPILVGILRAR